MNRIDQEATKMKAAAEVPAHQRINNMNNSTS